MLWARTKCATARSCVRHETPSATTERHSEPAHAVCDEDFVFAACSRLYRSLLFYPRLGKSQRLKQHPTTLELVPDSPTKMELWYRSSRAIRASMPAESWLKSYHRPPNEHLQKPRCEVSKLLKAQVQKGLHVLNPPIACQNCCSLQDTFNCVTESLSTSKFF
jgi:hypothetical protein